MKSLMFLDGIPTVALVLIIIAAVLLVVAIIFFIIVKTKKKGKQPRIKLNDEFITNLLSLLGEKENVSDVKVDNGRLKITVNDLDKANLEGIKEIATSGVFVTGTTIKTLFRLDSATIKKELDSRL